MYACVVTCMWGEQLWELFLPFHCVGHGDQTHISRLGAKPRYLLGHLTCPTCFLRHLEFKLHQLKKPEANPKTKAWVTSAFRGAGDTGREVGRDERKKSSRSVWDGQNLPRNHLSEEYGSRVFTQQRPVSSQEEGPVPGGTNGKLTGSATASIHIWALRFLFFKGRVLIRRNCDTPVWLLSSFLGSSNDSQSNKNLETVTRWPSQQIVWK